MTSFFWIWTCRADWACGSWKWRAQLGNGMRVLVLTAQAADLETRIACLEGGADDCMMKPFAMRELKARCRALVRRQDGGAVLRCGGLELNRLQQSLECGEESIALSRREFGLLEYLMLNRGRCVSRATLLERVWSASDAGNTNVVDVYINYLRRKLGPSASLIETVRGQGYRIGRSSKRAGRGYRAAIAHAARLRHSSSQPRAEFFSRILTSETERAQWQQLLS